MKSEKISLATQIKRVIGNRIFFCSFLLILITLALTAYDLSVSIDQLRARINEQLKPLEDFVINQTMANNIQTIDLKISSFNEAHTAFQVQWIPTGYPIPHPIVWHAPFLWTYDYPIGEIEGYQFGYFKIIGSFLSDKELVNDLLIRLALLIIFILSILGFLFPLATKIPQKLFINPINRFLDLISTKKLEKIKTPEFLPIELEALESKILNLLNQVKEEERNQAGIKLGQIAAQVAHDIRSPLSALQVLTEQQLVELEESKRILLRDAVYQIRDIINNLDQSPLPKNVENQIAILLEHVLSERRAAFTEKSIVINQHFGVEAYSLFVKASASEIKRVVTNLINNAAEAITAEKGKIDVTLNKDKNQENIIITISDNGCGISPKIFESIFTRGFTTKKSGSGLGLFYAKETITKLGGTINIDSIVGKGTTINITLPLQAPPAWFATRLKIPENSLIICVDDSISIWNAWQERLKAVDGNLELRYCKDKAELLRELGKKESRPCTYLIDYEFLGQTYTGLNLIEKSLAYKKPNDQVFLVTSRYDKEIQEFCTANNTLIISKFFALKIPVEVIKQGKE